MYEYWRCGDDVASKKYNMHKKIAAEMKDQPFNWQDSIRAITILTKFKPARNASQIHDGFSIGFL